MTDPLLTLAIRAKLMAHWKQNALADCQTDHFPVVKLFTPDSQCTWLLTELDPSDEDTLFGLCDTGQGFPELGCVSLSELQSVRGHWGLPVERDLSFKAKHPLSKYTAQAQDAQRIVT